MAQEAVQQDTDYTEPDGTVTLVAPSGEEYRTHNPVEINNLVYGQGYKLKDTAAGDDSAAPARDENKAKPEPNDEPAQDAPQPSTASATEAPAAPSPSPASASTGAKTSAKTASKAAAPSSTPSSTT